MKKYIMIVLFLVFAQQKSHAVTTVNAPTNLLVSATVPISCTVLAGAIVFGIINPAAQSTNQSSVSVTCTNQTPYHVRLNQGSGTNATVSTRSMTFGTSSLPYALYQDSAHTQNWGQTDGTDSYVGTGSGTTQTIPVYGVLPVSSTSNIPGGLYSDAVVVTVAY